MIDKYQRSLEELKNKLDKNPDLTEKDWNFYANKNNFFSSFTMQAHKDVYNWEQLKKSLKQRDKKLDKKVEKMKQKLNVAIDKYGLTSKDVIQLDYEITELTIIFNKNEEYKHIRTKNIYPKRKLDI